MSAQTVANSAVDWAFSAFGRYCSRRLAQSTSGRSTEHGVVLVESLPELIERLRFGQVNRLTARWQDSQHEAKERRQASHNGPFMKPVWQVIG